MVEEEGKAWSKRREAPEERIQGQKGTEGGRNLEGREEGGKEFRMEGGKEVRRKLEGRKEGRNSEGIRKELGRNLEFPTFLAFPAPWERFHFGLGAF